MAAPGAPEESPRNERPNALLDRFLDEAARRGDQVINRGRALLCVAAMVRLILLTPSQGFAWTHPRPLLVAVGVLIPGLTSAWIALRPISGRTPLALSTLLDPFFLLWTFLPVIIWPGIESRGVLSSGYFSAFAVSVAISALRLRAGLVLLAAAGNGLVMLLILGLDLRLGQGRIGYDLSDAITAASLFVVVAIFTYLSASWTRRLVYTGANASLQAERARRALGAYLSPDLAAELLGGRDLSLGGERRPVTVLLSDLRSFTAYASTRAPEALMEELNAYLQVVVEAVRAEGGTVDKYMGDAVLVVFGAPDPLHDAAARAIRATATIQARLALHNEQRAARGLAPFKHGIGVHSGEVIAGNIGTPDQLQYTVLGDAVNVVSRLQDATKELGLDVLISEATVLEAREGGLTEGRLRPCGSLQLRGLAAPIQVWTHAG